MSDVESEVEIKSKSKNTLDSSDLAAMNVLTWLRSFGMLFALAAGAWSGFQAAATSDLLGGAIRAAVVWGAIAGTVLVGSWVMGAIIWSTPPDAPKVEATNTEAVKQ
jgi:hypothetical protein